LIKLSTSWYLWQQFIKFTGIGVIGTAVQYAVLLFFATFLHVSPIISTSLGFIAGALVNYTLNYLFVFISNKKHTFALPRFLLVALCGLILNGIFVWFGINLFDLHYLVAQILSSAVILIWNFTMHKLWTFQDKNHLV